MCPEKTNEDTTNPGRILVVIDMKYLSNIRTANDVYFTNAQLINYLVDLDKNELSGVIAIITRKEKNQTHADTLEQDVLRQGFGVVNYKPLSECFDQVVANEILAHLNKDDEIGTVVLLAKFPETSELIAQIRRVFPQELEIEVASFPWDFKMNLDSIEHFWDLSSPEIIKDIAALD